MDSNYNGNNNSTQVPRQHSINHSHSHSPETQYRSYNYRFVVLTLFCFATLQNAMLWVTFFPVASIIQDMYEIDMFTLNLMSFLYMMLYIPLNFPANYVLDRWGLKVGIFCGVGLTFLGSWIRIFINHGFVFCLLGQAFSAAGQPFTYGAPAKLAANWFPPDARAVATAIAAGFNVFGCALGYIFPKWFVNSSSTREDVRNYLIFMAAFVTFLSLIIFILFREKPKTPPSPSAAAEKQSFLNGLKRLFKIKNYVLMFFSLGLLIGNFTVVGTIIDLMLHPFNYKSEESSLVGFMYFILGFVGTVIFGIILDRTKQFKRVIIITNLLGFIATVAIFIPLILGHSTAWMIILFGILGFMLIPMTAVSLEYSCELTFPIGEALSGGTILLAGQIFGIIQLFLSEYFIKQFGKSGAYDSLYLAGGIYLVSVILPLLVKEHLLRLSFDRKNKLLSTNEEIQNSI